MHFSIQSVAAGDNIANDGFVQQTAQTERCIPDLQPISSLNLQRSHENIAKKKPIDMDDLNHTMAIIHLHFPEEYSCTFDEQTGKFDFATDISLKYSIVKTVIGWNIQPHFNSILYDEKFVALLLNFVIGKDNLKSNNLPKERLRFIRGEYWYFQLINVLRNIFITIISKIFTYGLATFALRAKNDQRRSLRFGEYLHRKITRAMGEDKENKWNNEKNIRLEVPKKQYFQLFFALLSRKAVILWLSAYFIPLNYWFM